MRNEHEKNERNCVSWIINKSIFEVEISVKKLCLLILCLLATNSIYSQDEHTRQINKKLKILSKPTPDSPGGYVFDNSYEGLQGTPFLFDSYVDMLVKVKESDSYFNLEANIDLVGNAFLYIEEPSRQALSIPAQRVAEVIIENEVKNIIYRTTEGKEFNPGLREIRFYQVLKEQPYEFIKIPVKIFIPADYSGGYTAKRRYDELKMEYWYYVSGNDNTFRKIKLNPKSLIRLYPEKKSTIKKIIKSGSYTNDEEMILSILENL